jgi:hypothetical protein
MGGKESEGKGKLTEKGKKITQRGGVKEDRPNPVAT